ncbi:MAG TPA: aminodeoxychorismate/anthranilate synthase component II [Bacteroidia bacterium]|nr:aminodeoxychorismate/anthranilate synthase component II [Bacteroidia bacterium]HNT80399.1 aminodeoxychorismate/anthranilate synthase component II [Bacteroidia bacterium]
MAPVLIIDNYDSFTFNLEHYIHELTDQKPVVWRNNQFELSTVDSFDTIILSPGPGLPQDSGLMLQLIDHFHKTKKILGVCLGHQALAQYFGADLNRLQSVQHGVAKLTQISNTDHALAQNLPYEFLCGRYHSWVVDSKSLPDFIEPLAWDLDGELMMFAHRKYKIAGVQFHPESVMTDHGKQLLQNWLNW